MRNIAAPAVASAATLPKPVGMWWAEPADGGIALRRRRASWVEQLGWAPTAEVPPPGDAQRVVLIGESSARGLDCTAMLQSHLDAAAPGRYQCVNLMRTGGTVEQLTDLVEQLPAAAPDVVVLSAGNDWTSADLRDPCHTSWRASAWGEGGYAGLRKAFLAEIVLPRMRTLLRQINALHDEGPTRIVVIVPEFNLPGWSPPADIEVPALPPAQLSCWYELRDSAATAAADHRWTELASLAERMCHLDGGSSPVPGHLLAQAALAQGDPQTARIGLEQSRDALVGLELWHTPRIVKEVQDELADFARTGGHGCVDLRTILCAGDDGGLPDPRNLYSYCHLSSQGIDLSMAAVADAVLALPMGTTRPRNPVGRDMEAAAYVTAAVFGALLGSPTTTVLPLLHSALDAEPTTSGLLHALLDVLESDGPMWTHAALAQLASTPLAATLVGPQLMANHHPPELWSLREALGHALARIPKHVNAHIDLLAAPDGPGHRPANGKAPCCYRQATQREQAFPFALDAPRALALKLTHRAPHARPGATASLSVNGVEVAEFAAQQTWTAGEIAVAPGVTRGGVNWLTVRWPVPATEPQAWSERELAAIESNQPMQTLPVFGQLFDAHLLV